MIPKPLRRQRRKKKESSKGVLIRVRSVRRFVRAVHYLHPALGIPSQSRRVGKGKKKKSSKRVLLAGFAARGVVHAVFTPAGHVTTTSLSDAEEIHNMHCNDDLLESPAPASRRGSLLEDWPRRASSTEEANQDQDEQVDADAGSQSQSGVCFSEISTLYVYDDFDYLYLKKGYSKQDREIFGAQATKEANRIRDLIVASPPDSVSKSIKYLLEKNIITRDELVGIDHLIGKRTRVMQVRRDHMMAVLRKQHEQRQQQQQQQQLGEDSVIDLGKLAEQSSLKSKHHAIARAMLSCSPQNQKSSSSAKAASTKLGLGCYF